MLPLFILNEQMQIPYTPRHRRSSTDGPTDRGYRGQPGCRLPRFLRILLFQKSPGSPAARVPVLPAVQEGLRLLHPGREGGYAGFKDLRTIADETLANLQSKQGDIERITISGGGDPSCYPQFKDLIELLGSTEAPLHIGYTSGKGWDDPAIADLLIDNGLTEISFTVFATDPKLRKKYMHDPTPEASLAILERLCGAVGCLCGSRRPPGRE